jgi:hypothetical protein
MKLWVRYSSSLKSCGQGVVYFRHTTIRRENVVAVTLVPRKIVEQPHPPKRPYRRIREAMNNVTDKQPTSQQLWQREPDPIRKAPGKSVRGSHQYKLQKELLIVLLAPEILSDLKALAKKRKQSVDGLVEKIIEAYLASQHQPSRGPAENPEDLRKLLKLSAPRNFSKHR